MPTCSCCGQDIPTGQANLTEYEVQCLPMGNQNDDNLTLIQWQVVKGAAKYHDVTDWTSKVDTSLGLSENVNLMEKHGTNMNAEGGRTVRDVGAKEQTETRWTSDD